MLVPHSTWQSVTSPPTGRTSPGDLGAGPGHLRRRTGRHVGEGPESSEDPDHSAPTRRDVQVAGRRTNRGTGCVTEGPDAGLVEWRPGAGFADVDALRRVLVDSVVRRHEDVFRRQVEGDAVSVGGQLLLEADHRPAFYPAAEDSAM